MDEIKVGTGVIISGCNMGLHGGLLTAIANQEPDNAGNFWAWLPRKVEREMAMPKGWEEGCVSLHISEIIITIPNCDEWLRKDMP